MSEDDLELSGSDAAWRGAHVTAVQHARLITSNADHGTNDVSPA
jgi:hypothetical protein